MEAKHSQEAAPAHRVSRVKSVTLQYVGPVACWTALVVFVIASNPTPLADLTECCVQTTPVVLVERLLLCLGMPMEQEGLNANAPWALHHPLPVLHVCRLVSLLLALALSYLALVVGLAALAESAPRRLQLAAALVLLVLLSRVHLALAVASVVQVLLILVLPRLPEVLELYYQPPHHRQHQE